jgi:hypothetical protein
MQSKISAHTAGAATIVIEVDFTGRETVSLRHFSQGRAYIPLGEVAAEAALPRIAAALPWLCA